MKKILSLGLVCLSFTCYGQSKIEKTDDMKVIDSLSRVYKVKVIMYYKIIVDGKKKESFMYYDSLNNVVEVNLDTTRPHIPKSLTNNTNRVNFNGVN